MVGTRAMRSPARRHPAASFRTSSIVRNISIECFFPDNLKTLDETTRRRACRRPSQNQLDATLLHRLFSLPLFFGSGSGSDL